MGVNKIAYITWGCGSQIFSFRDYAHFMDDMLYLQTLPQVDLSQYAALIISCHSHAAKVAAHADLFNCYVAQGGFLIAFAVGGIEQWLRPPVYLKWHDRRIQDWKWWMKPGNQIELYLPHPQHSLCNFISLADMSWHWHGVYEHNGISLLNVQNDGGSVLADFPDLPGGGRIMLTTLDPHSHNGQRFMPATKRFLDGFYPWLNHELQRDLQTISPFTVCYLSASDAPNESRPIYLQETFKGTAGILHFQSIENLDDEVFKNDIVVVPRICDQLYLRSQQQKFMDYLKCGGQLIVSTEAAIEWLPVLKLFQIVSPKPFTNLKVRIANDPYGFFANMPVDFDSWDGVLGQYSRGFSPMPENAICLTQIGSEAEPSDWMWQYPRDDGRGGKLVVHNGDDYHRYPDHGPNCNGLLRDICLGLIRHRKHAIVSLHNNCEHRELRQTLANFATGVTIISTRSGEKIYGITVNSFSSVSLTPPLVQFCLSKGNIIISMIQASSVFAVNILSEEQKHLAQIFSNPAEAKFENFTNKESWQRGAPILPNCLASLDCSLEQIIEGGDHQILLGRVLHFASQDKQPLLYYGGSYHSLL